MSSTSDSPNDAGRPASAYGALPSLASEEILARTTDAFVLLDRDWVVRYLNPSAERFFGKRGSEVCGRTHWEEWPGSVGTEIERQYRRAMAEGTPANFEHHHVDDASDVYLDIHAYPTTDGLAIFFRDISAEVRALHNAEELAGQLEEQAAELQHQNAVAEDARARVTGILDSLGDIVASYDAEWRWTYLNPAARATLTALGGDVEHCEGRVVWEVLPQLVGTRFESESKRAAAERRIVEYEAFLPGLERWLENRIVPGPDGSVTAFSRDVTDRHHASEELRASEERYRALVEASTQMVWSAKPDGSVDDMPFWRKLTGQSLEEVRGNGWMSAIHPDDQKHTAALWSEAVRNKSLYEVQYRLRLTDGSYRWHRARAVPLRDENGTVREWVGVFNEIDRTMRREEGMRFLAEASAALTESLDERATLATLARLAVDHLADGCTIRIMHEDGRWEHVATRMRDAAIAEYVAETERMYAHARDATSAYPRAMRTGEPELISELLLQTEVLPQIAVDSMHLERLRKVGLYSGMVVPLVARGNTLGAITLVLHGPARRRPFDASDLALATELGRRAALALDNARLFAAERVARADAERAAELTRRLQEITASFARTLTFEEVADTTLSHGLDVLSAQSGVVYLMNDARDAVDAVRVRGIADEGVRPFLHLPLDADMPVTEAIRTGRTIYLSGRAEAVERYPTVRDANAHVAADAWVALPLIYGGNTLGAIALGFGGGRSFSVEDHVLVDALGRHCAQAIERARLLDAERTARDEAEGATRAKSNLLAKVSHETRQPVHATVGWVETIQLELHGPVTEAQHDALRRIKQNQSRLLGVLNDLLDMSRIEAGKLDLHLTRVVVASVVDAVESAVAPQMRNKGIVYDFCRPEASVAVRADLAQLVGILTNLVSNAAKFTPAEGCVTVSCHTSEHSVSILVEDSGIGIASDMHERVFEPFFQVEAGFTRTTMGTGLGLAISREAARAMGGDITLHSTKGSGSTFTVQLPRSS